MRFLYDMTEVFVWKGQHTGIQRVVYGLSHGFKNQYPNYIPFYIKDGIGYIQYTDERVYLNEEDIVFTASANWDRIDNLVFFDEAKKQKSKCVNLYYDLTPIVIPHSFKPGFCDRFVYWFDKTTKLFDYHLAISNYTKKDLVSHAKYISESNVHVVRLADEIPLFEKVDIKIEQQYLSLLGLDVFLISVGTIEFRKNHITLLNAYRTISKKYNIELPKLVLVGRIGWLDLNLKYQVDNDPLLKDKVIFIESATDQELDILYRNCMFTLYPSIYEGWGLPIAESLNYCKPCIASDNTSLNEIAPNIVLHARTLDPYDWAEKIFRLYTDSAFYDSVRNKIFQHHHPVSWDEAVSEILRLMSTIGLDI